MCHYKHLTPNERDLILKFLTLDYSISKIAKELNRNKSTISREIHRNSIDGEYLPSKAQEQYHARRENCRRHKILDNPELFSCVEDKFLNHQWSPDEISERLKLEHSKFSISYVTIYRAIYAGLFNKSKLLHGTKTANHKLRHHAKKRRRKGISERRGQILISHELRERPQEAADRSRLGDWEGDTVAGKTGRACFVTMVDRKSRFLVAGKAAKKEAASVNEIMIRIMQGMPLESITPDRGKEFARHKEVTEALGGVQFYFPLPRHPWERGTNENTNGLLREYFPKGKDLTDISEEYLQKVIDELNMRPRKCLGYRTPYEVFYSKVLHLT